MRMRDILASCLSLVLAISNIQGAEAVAENLSINASRLNGKIKHLNDVDNGPLCQRGIVDLSRYYKELGIQNVRLHDDAWSYDHVVDINYVFPNWDGDPDLPESYDFTQTDFYLKTITSLGINIIYRLGYSAEYKTAVHHKTPPASFEKWADIGSRIVRHYNEGWANGPKTRITYWEIWNEPDTDVSWTGTAEQYFHLYEITARKLTKQDPSLKIGGPVSGSLTYIDAFLKYEQARQIPVDFVSWHNYKQDPDDAPRFANKADDLMLRDGYPKAESILDEWNWGPSDWKTLFVDANAGRTYFNTLQNSLGAAYDEAVLIGLQNAHIDIATYYSGTTFMWGMFTPSGAPQKPYYAFLAFRRMPDTPHRLTVDSGSISRLKSLAGVSDDKRMVRRLISSLSKNAQTVAIKLQNLPWQGASQVEQQVVNERYDLQKVDGVKMPSPSSLLVNLEGRSVVLLTLQPSRQ
jgi:xylan 1,4-beta-xylosidase